MLARTRLKLKNAESSISFMQEQHAKTLEDLHREMEKLQKINASKYGNDNTVHITSLSLLIIGLTFELTMAGAGGKSISGKTEN